VVVLALALPYTRHDTAAETAADAETQWQRISDGFALHLSTVHPLCATAMIGDTTYGLVPLRHNDEEDDGQSGARTAGDFLERAGDRVRAVVSVGPVCHDVPGLVRARADADRALHVLRTRSGGARVARLPDVHAGALILELKGLMAARGEELAGPVTRLRDYDAHHGTELTQTLQAWLDTLGDITAASSALYVHPNTFRYRLRRVSEVGAMDLHDPEVRFAVMLQLRIGPSVEGHRTRSTAPAGHDRPPRSRPRSEQPGSS
jgi:sugar diacid utilization regulator